MSDPREGLERLQAAAADGSLPDLCVRHNVRILTVFGSAARGEPHPNDLDIAVAFERAAARDFLGLLTDLTRLTGVDRVDLLDLDRAGPVARERGLAGALLLYESRPFEYSRDTVAAIQLRMETAPLRRLDLELMAR